MALFTVVALLGLLTALALVVYTSTRIDFQISRNHVITQRALEQAESGLHYAKSEIDNQLAADLTLEDIASSFYVTPPSGFTFDPITALTQLADTNLYSFEVTGRSAEAQATLQVAIRQADAMVLGIFGDLNVDSMPNISAYSYDGATFIGIPQPADSTGEATIGSNLNIVIQPNVVVDGRFIIGTDEYGNVGTYPSGWNVEELQRIDPDPLGMLNNGRMAKQLADAMVDNDNASVPEIVDNKLSLVNHGQLVLPPGDYYLDEVNIGNHSEVLVDNAAGRVNIFLGGPFGMAPGGDLNITGKPSDFRVFSNSTGLIKMMPKGDSKVFVYAPDADVQIYPNNNFYGAVWGRTADLKPGGDVWIDTSLLKKVKANRVVVTSWKEIRG
jgi:Tfp pilus assembly protein PilX